VTELSPHTDKDENPFSEMGFVKFWLVSTLFWLCFPLSLLVVYIVIGADRTRQLVAALIHDFFQTVLIILCVLAVLIYAGYLFISGLF
jgi:hypothetical protein